MFFPAAAVALIYSPLALTQESASTPETPQQVSGNSESEPGSPSPEQESEDRVEADDRERGAEQDPMADDMARRKRAREAESAGAERGPDRAPGGQQKYASKAQYGPAEGDTGFDVYGSLRVRYRDQGGDDSWEDGGSRVGTDFEFQFRQGLYLFGRYEAGFNVLDAIGDITNAGDRTEEGEDDVFTRLAYAGIDIPRGIALVGKNWSSYYKIASFTDRFMGTGASASGAFNAQTDGGPTGPGRADNVLQTQLSIDFLPQKLFKPFDVNVQVQGGNPIPFADNTDYDYAAGFSSVLTTHKNFTVGLAYNHASIDLDANPTLGNIGITGNARAALIGTRAYGDRWYAGLVISRLENHETTDDGIYFHGWGSEFYGQYRIFDRLWAVGGFNVLEPDDDQVQAGAYQVKYGVIGLRFTFDEFRRMVYANIRIDDSTNADGTESGNVYTVGIRWDLSRLGWHTTSTVGVPPPAN